MFIRLSSSSNETFRWPGIVNLKIWGGFQTGKKYSGSLPTVINYVVRSPQITLEPI